MATTTPPPVWPPPPVTFSCCLPFFPPSCPPCPPCPQYLPLTTGRVGLSQTTGIIEFSGYNIHGTGIQDFRGYCTQWKPPCLPAYPWSGGSCGSFSNALAAVLTGKCA